MEVAGGSSEGIVTTRSGGAMATLWPIAVGKGGVAAGVAAEGGSAVGGSTVVEVWCHGRGCGATAGAGGSTAAGESSAMA